MQSADEAYRQRALSAITIALSLTVLLPPLLNFSVDVISFWPVFQGVAFFAVMLPHFHWRRMKSLYALCETTALTLLVSFCSLVLSYAGMRFSLPLADDRLARMDHALGLSTIEAIRLVNCVPRVTELLSWAYGSFIYQVIAAPIALTAFIAPKRAYQFLLAYIVLCLVSVAASIPFPSHGAVMGQGFDPSDFYLVNEDSSRGFISSFTDARTSSWFVLNLNIAKGILTFPSVHAGVAALLIWATWPSSVLRWPVAALNILMIASAICCGSHYFVDVFAGCSIAVAAALIAERRTIRSSTGTVATALSVAT